MDEKAAIMDAASCPKEIDAPCGKYVAKEQCDKDNKMFAVTALLVGAVGGFLASRAFRSK
jgi:hypothetical protein